MKGTLIWVWVGREQRMGGMGEKEGGTRYSVGEAAVAQYTVQRYREWDNNGRVANSGVVRITGNSRPGSSGLRTPVGRDSGDRGAAVHVCFVASIDSIACSRPGQSRPVSARFTNGYAQAAQASAVLASVAWQSA
jgi:hypothetical protein